MKHQPQLYGAKPEDLPSSMILPPDGIRQLARYHVGGFNTLFADGSVRFIKNTIAPGVLSSLITGNGGEVVCVGHGLIRAAGHFADRYQVNTLSESGGNRNAKRGEGGAHHLGDDER